MSNSSFPNQSAASLIAEKARHLGYSVERSAASAKNRSAYVFADSIKIRIADHQASKRAKYDIDVDPSGERTGAVLPLRAIKILRHLR